jgi:acetaldehyde dehydrogenase
MMSVHPEIEYVEIVASIASKSAGIGTRNNIDEYTQATSEGIKFFTGVKNAKAIIILNPAEPPIMMHNTIYAKVNNPKIKKLKSEIRKAAKLIKKYVPGYKITKGPVVENGRLIVMNEVKGRGDFLPVYAGNLDIINCAAIEVAENCAKSRILKK